jgi:molybdopterin-synthase adenylyltransferase
MDTKPDFSRQSFLGAHSEEKISKVRAVIVGLGGGGSHIAMQLAHVGVLNFRLIDPQNIEASNLNRFVTASQADVDAERAKIEILKRYILGVRPKADVQLFQGNWQKADHFIKDAHVVFGCLDGYRQREYLERAARRLGLPYIDIGMDVADIGNGQFAVSGQMIATKPGCPCMRCLGFLTPGRLNTEENRYGDAGINPQVVWTNGTLASLAVGEFVRLLTPWCEHEGAYTWLELDGNSQTVSPSRQPNYFLKGRCSHFDGSDDLGDPNFRVETIRKIEMQFS